MPPAPRHLLLYLCTTAGVAAGVAALSSVADPLQLLRPAQFYSPMY
jgi:hypothetical protein